MVCCSMCGVEYDEFFNEQVQMLKLRVTAEDTVLMCDECFVDQIEKRLLEDDDGKV